MSTVTNADLLVCPACGEDKPDRRTVCDACQERMPTKLRERAQKASSDTVRERRRAHRAVMTWARKQPGAPEWLDVEAILKHGYTADNEPRFTVPPRVKQPSYKPVEVRKYDVTMLPSPELEQMTARAAKAALLHLSRAKAAIDQVGEAYLGQLRGDCGVDLATPLIDAAGNETCVKYVNLLEEGGVISVGDLLDCFSERGLVLPEVHSLGFGGVAIVLATVLRRFVGGTSPAAAANDDGDEAEEEEF